MSGPVPAAILMVPVLPVEDLAAAAAGLRALGFQVEEAAEGPVATATASWPGLMLQLVGAPAVIGGCCHVVVEEIDALVGAWRSAGVEVQVIERGGGRGERFAEELDDGDAPGARAGEAA